MIFNRGKILLPEFTADHDRMSKWSVIACDQFTSEVEYWEECIKIIDKNRSTYDYIMPEAFLGTDMEKKHSDEIFRNMNSFNENDFQIIDGYVYVERTLPSGKIRHGIIGIIDLEEYDYNSCSKSKVRPTEATVVSRIPAREKIRSNAVIELPHILILTNENEGIYKKAREISTRLDPVYDFELMMNGGHLKGYSISGTNAASLDSLIEKYETNSDGIVYAVGDGNHSLAAAKSFWKKRKSEGASENDLSRYALCEITDIKDESLVFEPIYRLLKNCSPEDFIEYLKTYESNNKDSSDEITVITENRKQIVNINNPEDLLLIDNLQKIIDGYTGIKKNTVCDYIHGEESLKQLSDNQHSVGLIFNGIRKESLFYLVGKYGVLPRKTFSMGNAEEKRYYLEARKIR